MTQLVKKISKPLVLKIRLIIGMIVMGIAMFILPVFLLIFNASMLANPYMIGTVLVVMLLFGLIGYGYFVRPFLLFRKLPDVLAETDGEFLYIHSKKEAKIPLSELTFAEVDVDLPFLDQPSVVMDFWEEIISHYCAEEYGTIILELEGFGKYKLYFASYAQETANNLIAFIDKAMNQADQ
jgi:hypothetical protein